MSELGIKGTHYDLSIGIILCPTFPLLSLTGIVECLRHAGDIADASRGLRCHWAVLGNGGERVRSSCGISIPTDGRLSPPEQFDYVVLIGGLLERFDEVPSFVSDYIRRAVAANVKVVGVCTGQFILASMGLLRKSVVCVHPYVFDEFVRRYPSHKVVSNRDYMEDDRFITVPGGRSIFELMNYFIGKKCGRERALKIVHQMTLPSGSSRVSTQPSQGRTLVPGTIRRDQRIQRAIMYMEKSIAEPRAMKRIVDVSGLGRRQFARIFFEETGRTPNAYFLRMRLELAKWHLQNSDTPISEVAQLSGFCDCSHLTRTYRKYFGTTPSRDRASRDI